MVVDARFWKGRKVFLTGHTGFKGGWLSLWLNQLGAHVYGYALAPTEESIFNSASVATALSHNHLGDIRNLAALTQAMQRTEPEIVIHMAAQPLVRQSYLDPVTTYSTNVMGTVHVFEAIRKTSSVKAVLNITTDKCYDNQEQAAGYREDDPMGGDDPYSSSKGCAELVSSAYRKSFFSRSEIALATARAGNVIGGGDWAIDRIVPDAMRAFVHRQPLVVRNPHAIRPWQHVLEPLAGYLMLCQQLMTEPKAFSEGWNFGPNEEDAVAVKRVCELLIANWGEDASWQQDLNEHPSETHCLKLDCTKSKTRLNWKPVWPLERAFQQTVAWYKAWQHKQDMHAFTLSQIQQYQQEHLNT